MQVKLSFGNDLVDDPQTYATKYGIIYYITSFNHNVRDTILKKYKMLYLKSYISNVRQISYNDGRRDASIYQQIAPVQIQNSWFKSQSIPSPFGPNFMNNHIIGGNHDLNPFGNLHISKPFDRSVNPPNLPCYAHRVIGCIFCSRRRY